MRLPILAVLAASLSGGAMAAEPPSTPSQQQQPQIVYYDVTGNSARQLRTQLDALGPMDPAEHRRFDAQTHWSVRWTYRYERGSDGCTLRAFDVTLDTTMTLPRWTPPNDARASLREDWQRYSVSLRGHEDGHQAIGQAAEDAIRARFQEILDAGAPAADCPALTGMLDAAGKAILAQQHARELDYDRSTRHGATQGARFPP